jgi:hypothetical protein
MKLNYAYDINKDIVTLYDVISGKDKKFISIHWIHNNKISHIFIYDENYELYCASIYSGIFPGQYYLYYDELEWQHYISLYPYTKEKLSSSDYNHIDSYNTEENFVKLGKYYLKYVLQTLHKDSTIKKIKEKYPNGIQVMNSSWSVRDYNCQKFTIDKIFTL